MKKIISLILLLLTLTCLFSSCAKPYKNPLDAAEKLDEKDYGVNIMVGARTNLYFEENMGIDCNGVSYILSASPYSLPSQYGGYFFYCEKSKDAKALEDALQDTLTKKPDKYTRGTVERSGKIVFIGCSDVWENAQKKIVISF